MCIYGHTYSASKDVKNRLILRMTIHVADDAYTSRLIKAPQAIDSHIAFTIHF